MERRNFLAALASVPLWARPALPSESAKTGVQHYIIPPKTDINYIGACGAPLHPTTFRAARDLWGENCEVIGHPAQRTSWNEARLLMGNQAYSKEFNEELCDYFMGTKFRADYNLPKDVVEFRRNGKLIGKIVSLGIPYPYASLPDV